MIKYICAVMTGLLLFIAGCDLDKDSLDEMSVVRTPTPDGCIAWRDLAPRGNHPILSVELDSILEANNTPVFFDYVWVNDVYRKGDQLRAAFGFFGPPHLDLAITQAQYEHLRAVLDSEQSFGLTASLTGFYNPRTEIMRVIDEDRDAKSEAIVVEDVDVIVLKGTLVDLVTYPR